MGDSRSSIQIRSAALEDAGQILAIYSPFVVGSAVSFETEIPSVAEMRERIARVSNRYPWLVAVVGGGDGDDEGAIVGYAYGNQYRERKAYQWMVETSIYVAEEWRGRGVGRLLYAELIDALRRQGFFKAYGVITLPNEASARLHEACGFKPFAVYENVGFKLDRWHDVGWWSLDLQAPGAQPREPLPPENSK